MAAAGGDDATLPAEYFLAGEEPGTVSSAHLLADQRYRDTARAVFAELRAQGVALPTVELGAMGPKEAVAAEGVLRGVAEAVLRESADAEDDGEAECGDEYDGYGYEEGEEDMPAAAHLAVAIDDIPSPTSAAGDGFGTFLNPHAPELDDTAWADAAAGWAVHPSSAQPSRDLVPPPNYDAIAAVMKALGHDVEEVPQGGAPYVVKGRQPAPAAHPESPAFAASMHSSPKVPAPLLAKSAPVARQGGAEGHGGFSQHRPQWFAHSTQGLIHKIMQLTEAAGVLRLPVQKAPLLPPHEAAVAAPTGRPRPPAGKKQSVAGSRRRSRYRRRTKLAVPKSPSDTAWTLVDREPMQPLGRRGRDYTEANKRCLRDMHAPSSASDVLEELPYTLAGPPSDSLSTNIIGLVSHRELERDRALFSEMDALASGFDPVSWSKTIGTTMSGTHGPMALTGTFATTASSDFGVATLTGEATRLLDELRRVTRLPGQSAVAAGVVAAVLAVLTAPPPQAALPAQAVMLQLCPAPREVEMEVLPGLVLDDLTDPDSASTPLLRAVSIRSPLRPQREDPAPAAAPQAAYVPAASWAGPREGYYFGRSETDGRLGYHLDAPAHPRLFMRHVVHLHGVITKGAPPPRALPQAADAAPADQRDEAAATAAAAVAELGKDPDVSYVDMLQFRGFLRTLPAGEVLESETRFLEVSELMRQRVAWVTAAPNGAMPPLVEHALACCDALKDPLPDRFIDPVTGAMIVTAVELMGCAYDVRTIHTVLATPKAQMTEEQRRFYSLLRLSDLPERSGSAPFGDLSQYRNCRDFGLEYAGAPLEGDDGATEDDVLSMEDLVAAAGITDDAMPDGGRFALYAVRIYEQLIEECLCQRVYKKAVKDRKHVNDVRFCEAIVDDLLCTVAGVASLGRLAAEDDAPVGDDGDDAASIDSLLEVKKTEHAPGDDAKKKWRSASLGQIEVPHDQRLDGAIEHWGWEQSRRTVYQEDELWNRRRFRRQLWQLRHNRPEEKLVAHLRDCHVVQRLVDLLLGLERSGLDWSPALVVEGRRRVWHCLAQVREFFNVPHSIPDVVVFRQLEAYKARACAVVDTWAHLAPKLTPDSLDLDYDSFAENEAEDDDGQAEAAPSPPSATVEPRGAPAASSYREALGWSRGESRERQIMQRPLSRPAGGGHRGDAHGGDAAVMSAGASPTSEGTFNPKLNNNNAALRSPPLRVPEVPSLTRAPVAATPSGGASPSVLSRDMQEQILSSEDLAELTLGGWEGTPADIPIELEPKPAPPKKRGKTRPPGGRRPVPAPPRQYANCRGGTGGSFRAPAAPPNNPPPQAVQKWRGHLATLQKGPPDSDAPSAFPPAEASLPPRLDDAGALASLVVTPGTSPRHAVLVSPDEAGGTPPPALAGEPPQAAGAVDNAVGTTPLPYPSDALSDPSLAVLEEVAVLEDGPSRQSSHPSSLALPMPPPPPPASSPRCIEPPGSPRGGGVPALRLWREENQRKAARMKLADILRKGRRRPFWYEKEGVTPAPPGDSVLDRCALAQPVAHPAHKMPYAAALLLQSIGWAGHQPRQRPYINVRVVVTAAIAIVGASAALVPQRPIRVARSGSAAVPLQAPQSADSHPPTQAIRRSNQDGPPSREIVASALPTLVASVGSGRVVSVVAGGRPPRAVRVPVPHKPDTAPALPACRVRAATEQQDKATAPPLRKKREAGGRTFPAVPADKRSMALVRPQRTAATVPGTAHAPDLLGKGRTIPLDRSLAKTLPGGPQPLLSRQAGHGMRAMGVPLPPPPAAAVPLQAVIEPLNAA
eukprot:TRINITY_DN18560_c0_g1_i1.p1 TRINITY_DN18560_c0_g1~~TRINITY_DN18560_c0_g1_i1.p1  ORF type:complete len:1796 (+),score=370.90 TRINITY_DN18560_c0_g1_i1:39-5426(+)